MGSLRETFLKLGRASFSRLGRMGGAQSFLSRVYNLLRFQVPSPGKLAFRPRYHKFRNANLRGKKRLYQGLESNLNTWLHLSREMYAFVLEPLPEL